MRLFTLPTVHPLIHKGQTDRLRKKHQIISCFHSQAEGLFIFFLDKKNETKNYFMIIATLGIIQASLILPSLNAIIQGCTCLTHKTKTLTSKSAELALRSFGLQTAPLFTTPEFCFMARQLMPNT